MIPAAEADSWLFWLAIIDGLAAVYIVPTVIAIARQVVGLGLVICLNTIPVRWPAALILACMSHARRSVTLLSGSGHAGSSARRCGSGGDGTAIAENEPPERVRRPLASRCSGQVGVWMAGQEAAGCIVIDERIVGQPLDGPPLGAYMRNAYHAGSRSGYSSWSSSLKRRKAPLPWMARVSLRPARSSATVSAKSAMSWYQTQDGSGSMPTRSRSSRSTGVWPSMPVSAVQNAISPVCGLISHRCS